MADQHLRVPSLNDRALFEFFVSVAQAINAKRFSVTELGQEHPRELPLNKTEALESDYLKASDLYTVHRVTVGIDHFSVSLQRDFTQSSSPEFDKLSIHTNQNQSPPVSIDVVREVTKLISKSFYSAPEQSSRLFLDPRLVESLVKSHQELLKRLESTATTVTEQIVKDRLRLEGEFAERQSKLETDFRAKQERSDLVVDEMRKHFQDREQELEARKKLLDDRDHIHARRHLREQITANIADRLQGAVVPLRTSTIGWIVLFLALIGAGFLGTISYLALHDYSEIVRSGASARTVAQMQSDVSAIALVSAPSTWALLARGFLTGAGAVGFLVYALSWLKSMYHAYVKSHKDLERYSIDLNRASWAVETIMEAKASGGDIPDTLVAGISRNLFGDDSQSSAVTNGNEAVASLLRASVGAKIGPSGAEFQLNGRGANKIADKLD